ncbi:unnamed protein product [Soboliphyme baturini]|uniref:Pecanex-like protein n=1 Tax=Soboliphyme baturini TaxID=241478 RepID=A0A183ITT9_9BILA|nr:unnamed protein product [Soboliphyme baturini]
MLSNLTELIFGRRCVDEELVDEVKEKPVGGDIGTDEWVIITTPKTGMAVTSSSELSGESTPVESGRSWTVTPTPCFTTESTEVNANIKYNVDENLLIEMPLVMHSRESVSQLSEASLNTRSSRLLRAADLFSVAKFDQSRWVYNIKENGSHLLSAGGCRRENLARTFSNKVVPRKTRMRNFSSGRNNDRKCQ